MKHLQELGMEGLQLLVTEQVQLAMELLQEQDTEE